MVARTIVGGAYAWYVLGVLFVVDVLNVVDRQVISILAQGIKAGLGLGDAQVGFVYGTAREPRTACRRGREAIAGGCRRGAARVVRSDLMARGPGGRPGAPRCNRACDAVAAVVSRRGD